MVKIVKIIFLDFVLRNENYRMLMFAGDDLC